MAAIDDAARLPIQVALILVSLIHLAWVGAIAGLFTSAVAVDALGGARLRRFAGEIARSARLSLLAAAVLVVTASGILTLSRLRYPSLPQSGGYWAGVLLPLAIGLALLGAFQAAREAERRPLLRTWMGLGGIGGVVTSCYVLLGGAGVVLQPETWGSIDPFHRFLPTWSGTGRFVELTLLSFAGTGVLVATAGARVEEPLVARFARRFGLGTTAASLLALPPAVLFTQLNLPDIALSPWEWAVAAGGIALAGATAWLAASGLAVDGTPSLRPMASGVALLLGVLVAGDHLAREQVVQPAVLAGAIVAPAPPAASRPAAPARAQGPAAAGKAVYDRVCSLCHRFDVRLVGPPFNETVPKYAKDPEALKAFIRNPVKKNPGYPPMPKPAVSETEIDAVAAYLIEKAGR